MMIWWLYSFNSYKVHAINLSLLIWVVFILNYFEAVDNNLSGSSFEQLLSVLLMIDHYSLYSLNCSRIHSYSESWIDNFINDKAVSVLLNELQEGSFPSLKMVDIACILLHIHIEDDR